MCSWNSCGISMHCITYDFFFFSAGGLCVCEQAVCQELLGHSTVRHQLPSPHFIRHHKSRSEPTFCIEWRKRSAGFLKLCPLALIVLHRGFGEICNVNMFCVSQREKSQEIGQGETLKCWYVLCVLKGEEPRYWSVGNGEMPICWVCSKGRRAKILVSGELWNVNMLGVF